MKLKVASLPTLRRHARVWAYLVKVNLISELINSSLGTLAYVLTKIIRLVFQVVFVVVVLKETHVIAGYSLTQALFILITVALSSTVIQLFLRGVYMFQERIRKGDFDFVLLFPVNELFLSLFSYLDPMDLLTLGPYIAAVAWVWHAGAFPLTVGALLAYVMSLLVALLFAIAWHTVVVAFGTIFLEVDNLVMIYRDIEAMARYPLDIYGKVLEFILTFFIPLGIMAMVPSKVAFAMLSPWVVLPFLLLALFQCWLAFKFWRFALRRYTSASS